MAYKDSPPLTDLLIATLGSARNTFLFHQILRERKVARHKESTIRVTLSRLKKGGYIENSGNGWKLTGEGKKREQDSRLLGYLESPFEKTAKPFLVLSFDIPEQKRIIRDWLRDQIKIYGYKIIHQSLWIGPGPLPTEFRKRLKDLGIEKNIKIFAVVKKSI